MAYSQASTMKYHVANHLLIINKCKWKEAGCAINQIMLFHMKDYFKKVLNLKQEAGEIAQL